MKRLIQYLLYHIRQYFGLSRHETYGTLILLLLIAIALLLPYLCYLYDTHTYTSEISPTPTQ